MVSLEQTALALARVNYPGYQTDIISLGMVQEITPAADGGYAITLRSATDREEILRDLAGRIHQVLTHELGVKGEIKVHKIEPELGEKTGKVRLEGTRFIVAVASGKGGVGKSTV